MKHSAAPAADSLILETLRSRKTAMGVEELAELLATSKRYVYDQVRRNTIPAAGHDPLRPPCRRCLVG
jgi:hypothetical protein